MWLFKEYGIRYLRPCPSPIFPKRFGTSWPEPCSETACGTCGSCPASPLACSEVCQCRLRGERTFFFLLYLSIMRKKPNNQWVQDVITLILTSWKWVDRLGLRKGRSGKGFEMDLMVVLGWLFWKTGEMASIIIEIIYYQYFMGNLSYSWTGSTSPFSYFHRFYPSTFPACWPTQVASWGWMGGSEHQCLRILSFLWTVAECASRIAGIPFGPRCLGTPLLETSKKGFDSCCHAKVHKPWQCHKYYETLEWSSLQQAIWGHYHMSERSSSILAPWITRKERFGAGHGYCWTYRWWRLHGRWIFGWGRWMIRSMRSSARCLCRLASCLLGYFAYRRGQKMSEPALGWLWSSSCW